MSDLNIVVSFDGWRMRDMREFTKASQEGDLLKTFGMLAKVIKEWEFAGDPSDPASYDELSLDDWVKLTGQVREAISDKFNRGN